MQSHNIIDNRNEKLVDHINRILSSTEAARFAVGYFFLSGFECIAEKLSGIKELRLLIGNTTNKKTLEQIAEGYHRLELVQEDLEEQLYPKRTEVRRIASESAENIQLSMEFMDQTDEAESLIKSLIQLIEENRLKVRVYTKGRLHAKAYIFNYGPVYDESGKEVERHENGIAIVGSSNLTLSGVTHNTELNVTVQGNNNHAELVRWFDELWNDAQKFDEMLMHELRQSWAVAEVSPYDIYMKTLYTLVKDRLEGEEEKEILWDELITKKLADFQKRAVEVAIKMIRDNGGVFIADVVGLGKSFIGAALIKHFERTNHRRALIICPAPLVEMWEMYNEVYELNAQVLSMGFLREGDDGAYNFLKDDVRYRDRDFILIDESHNFRHSDTQRYKVVQSFLATGRQCCFLTATPRNKSVWDIYNQIKLFHQDERTMLPVNPPNLRNYFQLIERGERKLPDILNHLQIRRLRKHVLRWYGYAADTHKPLNEMNDFEVRPYLTEARRAYIIVGGKHNYFPQRELETIEYSIEDTYQGLYEEIRRYLGKHRKTQPVTPPENELTFARYGLWHYVIKSKKNKEPYSSLHRAGVNLRGLIRVLLFKRFESSVHAFRESVRRLINIHEKFLQALDEGIVPAGEDAQKILYESDFEEESEFLDALREVSKKYNADDFGLDWLTNHIEHDITILRKIITLVKPITSDKDAKLQTLLRKLNKSPFKDGKLLIFTQYADTAQYLYDNINPDGKFNDIDVIYSGDKSKARIVGRFAPKANPEYKKQKGETELNTVVATDVLAEGLNLQDCDKIINYDLHWNPVRLIQRFGRIDRIGTEHEVIYGYNFLPEIGLERNLGLHRVLHNRIQEIHVTIGEDAKILDESEKLNEEAMYAIYESKSAQLTLFEEEDLMDLNEAEQFLRKLQRENPAEFERIANLRDGIRSAKPSTEKGLYVFCQAGRYQKLFLLNKGGDVKSTDITEVLSAIKCGPDVPRKALSPNYNEAIMRVKRSFIEEVKHREAEKDFTPSFTQGQRYVLRELRIYFESLEDDQKRSQINTLDKGFRGTLTTAVKKELNLLRRNGVTGDALFGNLIRIYHQHNMKDWVDIRSKFEKEENTPKIICSEGLV